MLRFIFVVAYLISNTLFAQTLDFEHLECKGEKYKAHGQEIHEDGYTISMRDGELYEFTAYCVDSNHYPCSTALFNNSFLGLIRVTKDDGELFSADTITIRPLGNIKEQESALVLFTGVKANCEEVTYEIEAKLGELCGQEEKRAMETFTFPRNFIDLVSLEWTQVALRSHHFDDLVLISDSTEGTCRYTIKRSKGMCPCPKPGEEFDSDEVCKRVGRCKRMMKITINCPNGEPGSCIIKGKRRRCH